MIQIDIKPNLNFCQQIFNKKFDIVLPTSPSNDAAEKPATRVRGRGRRRGRADGRGNGRVAPAENEVLVDNVP